MPDMAKLVVTDHGNFQFCTAYLPAEMIGGVLKLMPQALVPIRHFETVKKLDTGYHSYEVPDFEKVWCRYKKNTPINEKFFKPFEDNVGGYWNMFNYFKQNNYVVFPGGQITFARQEIVLKEI
jgi:hypothetical protein